VRVVRCRGVRTAPANVKNLLYPTPQKFKLIKPFKLFKPFGRSPADGCPNRSPPAAVLVKMLVRPSPQKFNTFNTFATFHNYHPALEDGPHAMRHPKRHDTKHASFKRTCRSLHVQNLVVFSQPTRCRDELRRIPFAKASLL
jgi:hypothetical protein